MAKSSGYQVLIPYEELEHLLKSVNQLDDLTAAIKRVSDQQSALRGQFLDVMEAFRDLQDFVKD